MLSGNTQAQSVYVYFEQSAIMVLTWLPGFLLLSPRPLWYFEEPHGAAKIHLRPLRAMVPLCWALWLHLGLTRRVTGSLCLPRRDTYLEGLGTEQPYALALVFSCFIA